MKVYYLNDEQKEIMLRILDLNYDPSSDNNNNHTYHRMKSCEGRMFELSIPEGACLWIKKWPGMVMLSYLDRSAAEQLSQPASRPQDEVV